jgi:hypothetical protein
MFFLVNITFPSHHSQGFHGTEDSSRGLLDCDAVFNVCGMIPTLHSEDGGSKALRNVWYPTTKLRGITNQSTVT